MSDKSESEVVALGNFGAAERQNEWLAGWLAEHKSGQLSADTMESSFEITPPSALHIVKVTHTRKHLHQLFGTSQTHWSVRHVFTSRHPVRFLDRH